METAVPTTAALRHASAPALGSWPARRARIAPHRPALVEGERTVTYGELADRTARLAFPQRITSAGALRQMLVDLARRARA